MEKLIQYIFVALRLFLGGLMIFAGVNKFAQQATTTPVEMVYKAKALSAPDQVELLQKTLFIDGLQQSVYFWTFLALCEITFGLLLVLQFTGLLGAIMLFPITANIFLFHLFLEADEVGELIFTLVLVFINLALILKEKEKVQELFTIKVV